MKPFTVPQITVLQALAAGATVTAAAQLANVSRPTVYAWSDNPAFQQALAFAQQEYALTIQDRLQSLRAKALDKLEQVLDNPKSSPSVILRATVLLLTNKNWNLPSLSLEECAEAINAAADKVAADPEILENEEAYERQLTNLYTNSSPHFTKSDTILNWTKTPEPRTQPSPPASSNCPDSTSAPCSPA
jgi:hypothetical protein